MNKFMQKAIKEANKGLELNHGGPFGAVIVRNNKIIASAHNEVIKSNDPTKHAEMQAIRKAAKKLKRFDLEDCEIYSSCEPCPMCLAAIYWARIKKLYYGCTKDDAKEIGFADEFIYEVFEHKKKGMAKKQIDKEQCQEPFKIWKNKRNKTKY
ncbi:nucleoside deaminase [Candidatus Woesearchaeota archaeon]|nr:nucleoside deaminase [Candidatus Woesearchaeota archaeon]